MQRFACGNCGHDIYFENVRCERCGHALGFDPERMNMIALSAQNGGAMHTIGEFPRRRSMHYCANSYYAVCNWLTPADEPGLCRACQLNRTIPDLSIPDNVVAWGEIERAKKRLVYSLLRLGLPVEGGDGKAPVIFDFLANATTGHLNGVITIDIAEADAVQRELQRASLDERYRSVLGHMRHESGHYYWMRLVDGSRWHEPFRRVFGDERADYASALARHRQEGAPGDWMQRHVSAYAGAHPWEDWAETWAHYLHVVDALDTAIALGAVHRRWRSGSWFSELDAYRARDIGQIVDRWIPLALAMNGLSRSMGHIDFYPFVITPTVTEKLGFVHRVVVAEREKSARRGASVRAAAASG